MDSNANTSEQAVNGPAFAARSLRYISDESALGQRLNVAVNQHQRADFGYLLAMLSDNVLEHSARALHRVQPEEPTWQPPFALSPGVPLACTDGDLRNNPSADFHRNRVDWRLQQAIRPEGLNLVNDPKHIPAHVLENCAHFVQQRYQRDHGILPDAGANADDSMPEASNAADLIDVIDQLRGVDRAVA